MASLLVGGGTRLCGDVVISGAKNSALAIIIAAAMAPEETILENVPHNADVAVACEILRSLGARVWFTVDGNLHIDGSSLCAHRAPYDLVRRMRASFYAAGLLLARMGKAEVPLPGGCALGSRPVDFHIKGFQQLGAEVGIEHGYMVARARKLQGTKLYINRSSVGTTINLMMAATLAEGTTIIENAAKEPEVVDLAIFLNSMGARVRGAGTDLIRVDGVKTLHGTEYSIIPDRIEAGTYMLATAITGGEVTIHNVLAEHLRSPILKMEETGLKLEENGTSIRVTAAGRALATDIETAPYPGFPTDLQPPFVTYLVLAEGISVIRETIFDRFRFVDELRRMGADIKVEQDTAIVKGVTSLTGAPVEATDLRAGAALLLAGLAADGQTEIAGAEIIDRGYEKVTAKLRGLGAHIRRTTDGPEGAHVADPDPCAYLVENQVSASAH